MRRTASGVYKWKIKLPSPLTSVVLAGESDSRTPLDHFDMPGTTLIGATRMQGNLIAAFVLLVVGVALLGWLHRKGSAKHGFNWAPVIAFMCGPAIATAYFVADVLWFGHGTYAIASDYYDTYWRVLVIGLVAGTLGAIAFWMVSRSR
jgi:hypothetical protein